MMDLFSKKQRFSIRKYSIGVASVLIAVALFASSPVRADQVTQESGTTTAPETSIVSQTDDNSSVQVNQAPETPATSESAPSVSETAPESKTTTAPTSDISESHVGSATSDDSVATSKVVKNNQKAKASVAKVNNLPAQGTYTFTRRTEIKYEPVASRKADKVFSKGDHVMYEAVIEADGHRWLKFKDYNFVYNYADIATLSKTSKTNKGAKEPAPAGKVAKSNQLPDKGTYVFTKRSEIKEYPRKDAPSDYYYDKGESVNYDVLIEGDGLQWISYVAHSGRRLYVAVGDAPKADANKVNTTQPSATKAALPAKGTYTFTKRAEIKESPKKDAPSDYYYEKGMSVNYDKVLSADGLQWISYLSKSGRRLYVAVGNASKADAGKTNTTKPSKKAVLPAKGTYTFTKRSEIKEYPRKDAPSDYYYDKGMSVNYDKVLNADGLQWLSYLSNSGRRFYVAVGNAGKVNSSKKATLPAQGIYTFKKRLAIQTQPKVSSKVLTYYNAGDQVYYDSVIKSDGHQWLSYKTYTGKRLYIAID